VTVSNDPGLETLTTPDLDSLSVKELRDLRAHIDEAIRAAIRNSRVKPEGKAADAPVVSDIGDLERERDAWQAARKR
jgi:hypothetical protein